MSRLSLYFLVGIATLGFIGIAKSQLISSPTMDFNSCSKAIKDTGVVCFDGPKLHEQINNYNSRRITITYDIWISIFKQCGSTTYQKGWTSITLFSLIQQLLTTGGRITSTVCSLKIFLDCLSVSITNLVSCLLGCL